MELRAVVRKRRMREENPTKKNRNKKKKKKIQTNETDGKELNTISMDTD